MLSSLFRRPSALQLAVKEIEDARRELLAASSGAEYAQAMCSYHEARISRLRNVIRDLGEEAETNPKNLGN